MKHPEGWALACGVTNTCLAHIPSSYAGAPLSDTGKLVYGIIGIAQETNCHAGTNEVMTVPEISLMGPKQHNKPAWMRTIDMS